jgi:hypothetical protein
MLVLFDNGTPRNLARYLIEHHTATEYRAREWLELQPGPPVWRGFANAIGSAILSDLRVLDLLGSEPV